MAIPQSPRAQIPAKRFLGLTSLAGLLVVAFVAAPRALTARGPFASLGEPEQLSSAFRDGFAAFWTTGGSMTDPGLTQAVEFWQHYHLAKAACAGALLLVFFLLGRALVERLIASRSVPAATGLAAALSVVGLLGLLSTLLVVANVQGALAPFAGLFPTLASATDDAVATAVSQARENLVDSGPDSTALALMVADFVRFHMVVVVLSSMLAGLALVAGFVAWRRCGRSSGRRRRVTRSLAATSIAVSLAFGFLAMVNLSTALRPAPALAGALAGGL